MFSGGGGWKKYIRKMLELNLLNEQFVLVIMCPLTVYKQNQGIKNTHSEHRYYSCKYL